jgi:hypothetical protein
MAKSSKKARAAYGKSPALEPIGSVCKQYVQLRTLLDSLEVGALRYYLNGTTPAEKTKKFDALKPKLMEIIQLVWGGAKEIQCPPGYSDCDGCCVPYSCFME